jgi:hypothetical protein
MTAPARATRLVLALALLPAATATHVVMTSDLSIYFADPATGDIGNAPEDDTCTYSTEFVQSMDAQAGCGIPIVVDGVAVNQSSPPIVTWIANGRNAIHIKTRTGQIAPQDDPVLYNITVGLQVSSYSDDRVRLCDQMSVLRQGFEEGMTYKPITNLGDPTSVNNDATITASDQGNTIYAIPYALRPIHGPPYPELTIVLIPSILQENIHSNCSIDPDAGTLVCNCDRYKDAGGSMTEDDKCRDFSYEKLEPIRFTVQVRTEPLLRDLRDEVVDSCEYAFQADHMSTHGGLELMAESGAAVLLAWRARGPSA